MALAVYHAVTTDPTQYRPSTRQVGVLFGVSVQLREAVPPSVRLSAIVAKYLNGKLWQPRDRRQSAPS
jgi:hypothetical protein